MREDTYRATENNCEVIAIGRGWQGLTHVNLDDKNNIDPFVLPLTRDNTRTIDRYGGTVLHSSRVNPSKVPALPDFLKGAEFPHWQVASNGKTSTFYDVSSQVLRNFERLKLDPLIAIAGVHTVRLGA